MGINVYPENFPSRYGFSAIAHELWITSKADGKRVDDLEDGGVYVG